MSEAQHGVRHLVFRRNALPKAARQEVQEVEDSIRYVYRGLSDRSFRAFLFLTDCRGMLGRAMAAVLLALGLDKLREQLIERLKGDHSG